MKSQVNLLSTLIHEYGELFGIKVAKDVETLQRRFAHEGQSFLEITLPALDDYLLGRLSGHSPTLVGWKMKGGVPKFLYEFWIRVFPVTGSTLPCPASVKAIRQISRSFKKIFEVCPDDLVNQQVNKFVETDREIGRLNDFDAGLADTCDIIFGDVLRGIDYQSLLHKHGPGAVAGQEDSVGRYDFPVISPAVSSLYGVETFRATWSDLHFRPPEESQLTSRLVAVPKTATKPRLICIEPAPHQYIQQGIMAELSNRLTRYAPSFSYERQERNQELARVGSIDGSRATIDLSDASDRVSNKLVRSIFGKFPSFYAAIQACRTPVVNLPNGDQLQLEKFASMGNALTFPVETMVFATIVVHSIRRALSLSRKSVKKLAYSPEILCIYGDDIIVPTEVAAIVMKDLESNGLKVNSLKSFTSGPFRESCGGDYLSGINVTPIYFRRNIPKSRRDVSEIISVHATAWQFHHQGLHKTARALFSCIPARLPFSDAPPPTCSDDKLSSKQWDTVPAFLASPYGEIGKTRWNSSLQRREVMAPVPSFTRRKAVASDSAVLFKALAESGAYDEYGVISSPDHKLTHHGRPVSAYIKHRWCPSS